MDLVTHIRREWDKLDIRGSWAVCEPTLEVKRMENGSVQISIAAMYPDANTKAEDAEAVQIVVGRVIPPFAESRYATMVLRDLIQSAWQHEMRECLRTKDGGFLFGNPHKDAP